MKRIITLSLALFVTEGRAAEKQGALSEYEKLFAQTKADGSYSRSS